LQSRCCGRAQSQPLGTPPFRPVLGIDELAAEAIAKRLGVRALRKAEDEHVGVIAAEGVRPRTQREAFGEEADRHVVVAAAASSRQCNLVRPLPIHRAFAELSFAVDHGTTELVAARAQRYLPGRRGKRVAFAELRAAIDPIADKNKK
jgi:hypothetical protein